jgi:outer membrane receptor protein involved in Fe transport
VVTDEQNESTLDGLTIQLDSTLPGDTLLTWGAEFYADSIDSSRQQSIPGVSSPLAVRSRFPDDSSMDSLAFYANSEWRITPRLNLSGGLRWSKFDITLPAGTDNARAVLKPDDLTGDIHLVFALNDETHLVANAGRGFRPPNIFDLGTLGARPGNRFNIANPDLEAESVWSYDIGIKMVHDYWQAELFGWYSDYKDKITSVATGELTPSGRVIVKSENRNQVTLYGLEAGLRWFPGENIEVFGTLNYTHGDETAAGTAEIPADRIPPLNGRLGLSWEPDSRFRLESYWLFADHQDRLNPRDVRDPRIDPFGTPGWGSVNVRMSWQATTSLQLGLNLENIGDKAYREHGSGIDAAGFNAGIWANLTF